MPQGSIPIVIRAYSTCTGEAWPVDQCYSHDLHLFTVTTDISYASINNYETLNIKDFTFQNTILKVGEQKPLQLTFLKTDGNYFTNSPCVIKMLPVQVPPTYYADYLQYTDSSEAMSKFFTLKQSANSTDANGQISVTFSLSNNYYGLWAFILAAGSASTKPFFFKTDFPIATIQFIQSPGFIASDAVSMQRVGDKFSLTPILVVYDTSGKPVSGVAVTTMFALGSACENGRTTAMLDLYTFGCVPHSNLTNYITFDIEGRVKNTKTDKNGKASLDNFGLIDVAGKACVKFVFVIGEPGMQYMTAPTSEICVVNDYKYELDSSISLKITDGQPFHTPPKVKIKRTYPGSFDMNGPMILAGLVRYIDKQYKDKRVQASAQTLQYNYCIFYKT